MITLTTIVDLKHISSHEIYDFMLNCTDADYQTWWPGTHLKWHTLRRRPGDLGNLVYFDEYVGKRRLKFRGIVTELLSDRKIVWQMVKLVRLPAWLTLELAPHPDGLRLVHTLSVGFNGPGKLLDPLLRLYFTDAFARTLDEHARAEFPMLGEMIIFRRKTGAGAPRG